MLKKLVKDVVIYGISSAITKFVGLLLIPLYTQVFSTEDYGTMDLVVTIVAISTIFGMMQLESGVARFYYLQKNENDRNTMVSTAMLTIITASLLIFLIIVFFSGSLSKILFGTNIYSPLIIIGCLTIPFSNLTSLFTVIIQFKKKPIHYLLFQFLQVTITISLTVYLVIIEKQGIVGVFWGQLSGFFVSSMLMAIYLRKQLSFKWKYEALNKMLRYSLPLVPAVTGNIANSYFNRFIMLGYLSLTEIGLYAVALKIASVFQLIGTAFRMAWNPFFWETYENNPNHREVFVKVQKEVSVMVLMVVLIITLFSKEIIIILTTESYFASFQLIGLISLSVVITSIILPLTGIGPGITKKTEYNTLIYFLGLGVNIVSLFFIVPAFGIIGVPISMLLGNITLLIVGWYNSERLYNIGFKKLSMLINMVITLVIIILNLLLIIPLYIKILMLIMFFVFAFNKYKLLIMQFLDKKKTEIKVL